MIAQKWGQSLCTIVQSLRPNFVKNDCERILILSLSFSPAEGQHSGAMAHLLFWLLSFLGVPDHKGGAVLLLIALVLSILLRNSQRHLAVDIGGERERGVKAKCIMYMYLYT